MKLKAGMPGGSRVITSLSLGLPDFLQGARLCAMGFPDVPAQTNGRNFSIHKFREIA